MNTKTIRTRMAPAPTGRLHIGTAHTALFNFLFAKHHKGKFILRIDDSDAKRSKSEFIKDIIKGFKWLGINWDEGPDIGGPYTPYTQSKAIKRYQPYIKKLLESNKAYKCYCSQEELAEERKKMQAQKLPPMYSGNCRNLTKQQELEYIKQKRKPVIRLKVSPELIKFNDPTRGEIKVKSETIGDFVLVRSDGSPLLVLTTTIDDIIMKITHTIRGEDFINLVPRQILLFKAMGEKPPIFAHLQFIYGPDGGKLSKRHGAKSILEFKKEGYVPEAVISFLAYLGWSYKDNSELLTINQLIKLFDLNKVQKGRPIFDIEKLNYFNSKYIRNISIKELIKLLKPFLTNKIDKKTLIKIIPLIKERLVKLTDINFLTEYFITQPEINLKEILKESKMDNQKTIDYLKKVESVIKNIKDWNLEAIEKNLHQLQEKEGLKPRPAFMTLRLAITGRAFTPPLFDVLEILGQETVIKRLQHAQKII